MRGAGAATGRARDLEVVADAGNVEKELLVAVVVGRRCGRRRCGRQ